MRFQYVGIPIFVFCALVCPMFAQDVVLVGGTIIDGSGKPRVQGNVRIRSGKIEEVGTFRPRANERAIDIKGLIVAPGFIDLDNHSAGVLDANLGASSQLAQGITTAALGLHGEGPTLVEGFMARFDEKPPAINIVTFAGHNGVRRQVMGQNYRRPATSGEIQKMADLVEQAMRQGALGLSSNLESGPGSYSTLDELAVLAGVVSRYAGIYVCQLRSAGDNMIEALREAIEVGRRAKIPVHITNLKIGGPGMSGRAQAVLAEIDKARSQKIDVTADVSPYGSFEGDVTAVVSGDASPSAETVSKGLQNAGGAGNILIARSDKHPEYALKTLAEIAAQRNMPAADLYAEMVREGGTRIVCSCISEKDMRALLVHAAVMVASDGGIENPHPRGTGTFPRLLGSLVREDKLMTLETAIRKITTLPASLLGLKERGILQKGAAADIVVFDPTRIQERSTLQSPATLSDGIRYVFVNGVAVLNDGNPTEERPGVAIR